MCKRAKEKTCADRLLPRNLSSFSRDRHCALPRLAFVSVELLLNSRLPQLARVCRELGIAGFTNSARRGIADSFCNPKTALCHNSVSHSAGKCASPRLRPSTRRKLRLRLRDLEAETFSTSTT